MKTVEVKINDIDYVVQALNAHDASFLAVQFLPILISLQSAVSTNDDGNGIATALGALTKEKYNDVTHALFSNIKRRDANLLCKIFDNGQFIYADINEDAYVYISLLKESFMLSFKDFLASAARAFPSVATALSMQSSTPA
jgi:hypothetical protein